MRLILMLLLAALPLMSGVAQVETPDQCAARLDDEIEVRSIVEATNWYEQVMRECVEAEGEGMLRLSHDEPERLPNTGCGVAYVESKKFEAVGEGWVQLLPIFPDPIESGSIKLHWRHGRDGEWQALESFEMPDDPSTFYVRDRDRVAGFFSSENIPTGAGLHQFELRTRKGADKFEIMETRPAHYIVVFVC